MRRVHRTKIVATLGPASSSPSVSRPCSAPASTCFGSTSATARTTTTARASTRSARSRSRPAGRSPCSPTCRGRKLRLGTFATGPIELAAGDHFRLDLDPAPAITAAPDAHPEIFAALTPGADLLLDDGRVRLRVEDCGPDFANTTVVTAARLPTARASTCRARCCRSRR